MAIFKNYFFHDLTRKYQIVFGSLFQDMQVKRWKGDKVKDVINVSVLYSPKEKFIHRLTGDIDPGNIGESYGRRRTALTLPAIAYEMTDMAYDGQRKIAKNSYMKRQTNDIKLANKTYTPTPYTLTFEVNIVAATQTEMNQIIEQIIPGFQPDVNITVKAIDGVHFDVPITFTGLFRNDNWEGGFEDRRTIMYTLNFTMKAYYFAPVEQRKIILDVTADLFHMHSNNITDAELLESFKAAAINADEWEGGWEDGDSQ